VPKWILEKSMEKWGTPYREMVEEVEVRSLPRRANVFLRITSS